MRNRFTALLLALALTLGLLGVMPAMAAENMSGNLGPNTAWTIEGSTLTITGTGTLDVMNYVNQEMDAFGEEVIDRLYQAFYDQFHREGQAWNSVYALAGGASPTSLMELLSSQGIDLSTYSREGLTLADLPETARNYFLARMADYLNDFTASRKPSLVAVQDRPAGGWASVYRQDILDNAVEIGLKVVPWYHNKDGITDLVIDAGITGISPYTFLSFPDLQTITVANTVTDIGDHALGYNELGEKDEGVEIVGLGGTAAADYAETNGLSFQSVELLAWGDRAPTCTADGLAACWTDGTKYFSDAAGTQEVTLESVTIPALGHDWGEWELLPATNLKKHTCRRCGATEEIRADIEAVAEKAATCTEPGNQAYWTDGTKYYADAAGTQEVTLESVTIPALGHEWSDWRVITPATEEAPGLEDRMCARCLEKEQREIPKLEPGGSLANFVKIQTYEEQFEDVATGTWYHDDVAQAFELGLVKGVSDTNYNRKGDIKIGETIALACRIHSIYMADGETFAQGEGEKWYDAYVRYAIANDIIAEGEYPVYNVPATRVQFAAILAKALPAGELTAKEGNSVPDGTIPDVAMTDAHADDIYMLYRAGVLNGNSGSGDFKPGSNIQRSEVAAIIVRMAIPERRKAVQLGG